MSSKIVSVPGSVANVGPGYDCLGFCMQEPRDIVEVSLTKGRAVKIKNDSGVDIPLNPYNNISTVSIDHMLKKLGKKIGYTLTFHKKIRPASGIGSSAASACAGVFALNELLDKPFTMEQLVYFAMMGEGFIDKKPHADNVAPAMLGNFVLIRSNEPLKMERIKAPENLHYAVVHPEYAIKTNMARDILPHHIPLDMVIKQTATLASFISALHSSNYRLIKDSVKDFIIEPVRSKLIPGFEDLKKIVLKKGALACSISGAGPSVFALTNSRTKATEMASEMKAFFKSLDVGCDVYANKIASEGARIES